MNLEEYYLYGLSQGLATSTMKKRVNLLSGLGLDLDTVDFYAVAKCVYELDRTIYAKKNLATAINHYWKYRDFRYTPLRVPRLTGDKDIWIPSAVEKEKLLNVSLNTSYSTARARLIVRTLFETGMRAGELCGLKRDDVRFMEKHRGNIYYLHVIGKGNKERQIPISKSLYQELILYYRYHGRGAYVFGFSPAYLRKIIATLRSVAGVPQFHAHAARHYRAVELLREGVSLESLRKYLGHSRLDTTQIYLRSAKDCMLNELLEKDVYFGGENVE